MRALRSAYAQVNDPSESLQQKTASGMGCWYCNTSCNFLFVSTVVRSWLAFPPHSVVCVCGMMRQTERPLADGLQLAISPGSTGMICQNPGPISTFLHESGHAQLKKNLWSEWILLPAYVRSPDLCSTVVRFFCLLISFFKLLKNFMLPRMTPCWGVWAPVHGPWGTAGPCLTQAQSQLGCLIRQIRYLFAAEA